MWIVQLALRRPYTFAVMAIAIMIAGFASFRQTRIRPAARDHQRPDLARALQRQGLADHGRSRSCALASQRISARRTAGFSQARYRAGLVSYLEVVESERMALTTERDSAWLAGQRLVTSVQLIKALGGGWADSVLPRLVQSR